jgi:hypothetical protein
MSIQQRYRLNLQFGEHAKVDDNAVSRFSDWLKAKGVTTAQPQQWRDPDLFPEDSCGLQAISQFFALGNSINFRYWAYDSSGSISYCEGKKGGKPYRGAFYMWRSLKTAYDRDPSFLDADKLASITLQEVRELFKDDNGREVMPALDERTTNWNDLGAKLRDYWSGQFLNLVRDTNKSLFLFVQFSRQFRAFDDPLCKMIMVNAIMHQGRGLVSFDERPVPGIDYELLKQLMRNGIVQLDKSLEAKVSKGELLFPKEAKELRMAGLYAFIRMIENTGLSGDILDNKYWLNRTACRTDAPVCKTPGMEDKCIFYGVCPEKVELKIPYELTRYY